MSREHITTGVICDRCGTLMVVYVDHPPFQGDLLGYLHYKGWSQGFDDLGNALDICPKCSAEPAQPASPP
jgi:hypothetical protein